MSEYEKMAARMHGDIDAAADNPVDASAASAAQQIASLQALVKVLESGITIGKKFMDDGKEPYPGAARNVLLTSLKAVELARRSKLMPHREDQ